MRAVIAVILGLVLGSIINMAIVTLGATLVPPPPGVDTTDAASLAASAHLLQPRHFLAPFLAHALGTFVGALIAYLVATGRKRIPAYVVGGLFLLGGIAACFMIPAPVWFIVLDLVLAYLPMAWLACWLGARMQRGGGAVAPGAG